MVELCDNGIDDDGDGLIDIFDEDCSCQNISEENLVPNGNFESRELDCCTRSIHGEPICVDNWSLASGTPDLVNFDCIIDTERDLYDVPLDQTFFGLLVQYSPPNPNLPDHIITGLSSETIGTCLSEPLIAGNTYKLSIDVGRKLRRNQSSPLLLEDFMLTINGITDCDSLKNYNTIRDTIGGFCDKNLLFEVLSSINLLPLSTGWNTFEMNITPNSDIEAIFFNGDCNFSSTEINSIIALIDNINIQKIMPPELLNEIIVDGSPCEQNLRFSIPNTNNLIVDWYKDSIPFRQTVGGNLFPTTQQSSNTTGIYHAKVNFTNGSCQLIGPLNYEQPVLQTTITDTIFSYQSYLFDGINLTASGIYTASVLPNLGCEAQVTLNLVVLPSNTELCDNGIDDNGDGKVDAFDEECSCREILEDSNLVPNSGFDEENGTNPCRDGISLEGQNPIADWIWISGNPDYFRPGCSPLRVDNNAQVGSFLGLAFTGTSVRNDSEAMGACLNQPLLMNQTYEITLSGIFVDNVIRVGEDPFFTIYGVENCSDLMVPQDQGPLGFCAKNIPHQALFSFNTRDFTPRQRENLTVSFTNNLGKFEGIILAGGCEQLLENNFAAYLAIDELSIQPIPIENPWIYEDTIVINGAICMDETLSLSVPSVDSLSYQWYLDSLPIRGETTPQLVIPTAALYTAINYHLHISTPQGDCKLLSANIDIPIIQQDLTIDLCEGEQYFFGNGILTQAGFYQDTLLSSNGCDSFINLTINVLLLVRGDTLVVSQPIGSNYTFNGKTYMDSGLFADTISTEDGCDSINWLQLTLFDPCENPLQVSIEQTNPSCVAAENGRLEIFVSGGTPPYRHALNNAPSVENNLFTELVSGDYTIEVLDANNCQENRQISLEPETSNLVLVLPKDTFLQVGQSITITLESINFEPSLLEWVAPENINCKNCENLTVQPVVSTYYILRATDTDGCQITDSVFVEVKNTPQFFVPNVFSPNGDGQNDLFQVNTSPYFEQRIESMAIYNRWGNLLFQQQKENESTLLSWNGTHRQQPVDSGTYLYTISIIGQTGRKTLLNGTIQLVR